MKSCMLLGELRHAGRERMLLISERFICRADSSPCSIWFIHNMHVYFPADDLFGLMHLSQ